MHRRLVLVLGVHHKQIDAVFVDEATELGQTAANGYDLLDADRRTMSDDYLPAGTDVIARLLEHLGEDTLDGEITLLETQPRTHDNLEGIAVWQDALGDMRITMISDDNHRFFQKNEIVEYIVPGDLPPPEDNLSDETLDPDDENL